MTVARRVVNGFSLTSPAFTKWFGRERTYILSGKGGRGEGSGRCSFGFWCYSRDRVSPDLNSQRCCLSYLESWKCSHASFGAADSSAPAAVVPVQKNEIITLMSLTSRPCCFSTVSTPFKEFRTPFKCLECSFCGDAKLIYRDREILPGYHGNGVCALLVLNETKEKCLTHSTDVTWIVNVDGFFKALMIALFLHHNFIHFLPSV